MCELESSNFFSSIKKSPSHMLKESLLIPDSPNSSNGVLVKGIIERDGKSYIVKTGEYSKPRFSTLEPVTEVICCEIIKLLGVNCANYFLEEVILEGNDYWKTQKVLCSFSENFLLEGDNLIHASKILGLKNRRANYLDLIKSFNELDINNMLVVDYLLNNTDRHLRNFGKIVNNETGEVRFSPLFDHGFCLGQDLDGDYLEEESDDFSYAYTDCDYSKCCGLSNSSQIDNVKFTTVNLNIDLNEVLSVVDKYSNYLPGYRIEFMKYLLTRRFNYARKIFSKNERNYFRRDN